MKITKNVISKNIQIILFGLGLIIVCAEIVPYILLGKGSIITIPDQLDGEIVAYFLAAKHFGEFGTKFYPEFMGGVASTSVMPPSPGSVLFYVIFDLLTAFIANLSFVIITAYIGMFLLCRKLTGNAFYAMCSGVLFAYLPFQTVYGLSVAGVPLVCIVFLNLKEFGFKKWQNYLIIALYAAFSSPVLCGYAVVSVYFIALIALWIGNRRREHPIKIMPIATALLILVTVYGLLNYQLISEIVFGTGEPSHKAEYVYSGLKVTDSFRNMLSSGNIGAPSLHTWVFYIAIITIFYFSLLKNKSPKLSRMHKQLTCFFTSAVLIALFYSFIQSGFVAALRTSSASALASFQIDRFYWLYPCIWYVSLSVICSMWTERYKMLGTVVSLTALMLSAFVILQNCPFKTNLRELMPQASNSLSYEKYMAEDQYKLIANTIYEKYGLKQDQYRIASLGLEPAVSVVNGFWTIDGYSNNYPLSYKHTFREIMAKELAENEYNRVYFDEWGNRCYIFASDYYGNAFLSKSEHAYYQDLNLNTEALKEMGCDFLFAAGMIENAEDLGLDLVMVADDYS